jgi:hypothetical protein
VAYPPQFTCIQPSIQPSNYPTTPPAIGNVSKFQRAREMQAARGKEKLAGSKHPDDILERTMDPAGEAAARDEMMRAAEVCMCKEGRTDGV